MAFPEPVLKYFSSVLAFRSVLTATNASKEKGLYGVVDFVSPELCSSILLLTLSVEPI
jgi:hypothetical protein